MHRNQQSLRKRRIFAFCFDGPVELLAHSPDADVDRLSRSIDPLGTESISRFPLWRGCICAKHASHEKNRPDTLDEPILWRLQ